MCARVLTPVLVLALASAAGCAQISRLTQPSPPPGASATTQVPQAAPPPDEIAAVVAAPPPPEAATTVEQFDTTSEAQREAARAAPAEGEAELGEVVASLGSPTEPGLWIKTPLVSAQAAGRVEYPAGGTSAVVELRPLPGGGGSQLSLAAMRTLEVPLTELPTVVVYRQ